jgi:hypothetical protein
MLLAIASNGLVTACSGDDNGGDAGDAASDAPIKKEASTLDVQQDTTPPVVVTPAGKQLYASNLVQVFGVTTDNLVIFGDNGTDSSLYAADATGTNPPVKIATPSVSASATYIVGISGKVVFLWENVNPKATQQIGKLSAWTSAGGLHQLTAASNAGSGFNSSTDGTKVMFSANATTTSASGDIVGSAADGSAPSTLVTGVDISSGSCTPLFGFAGGVNPVVATCASDPGDGGTPVATVKSFNASTWAATALSFSGLNFWSATSAGDKLLVASTTDLEVLNTDGTTIVPTIIDTKDINGGGFGYMEKDGQNVLYASAANALYTSPTAVPLPVTLEASGVKYFRALSNDDKYILYSSQLDSQQFGSDIYLQSTSTAGKTTLVSGTTGALFGLLSTDNFTTDSKYALFIENVNTSTFTGDLMSVGVGGGTPVKLGSDEWLNLSATGSKIVFNDNCQGCGTNSAGAVIGVADIKSVDVSAATPTPTPLQAGADPQIYMAAPKDRVIFTYSQNVPSDDGGVSPAGNGLYSIAIP